MQEFIVSQWANIVLVLVVVVSSLILIKRGYGYYVNEMLFYLVTKAEGEFGSGTGELKYAAVATWLYEKLPTLAKLLFTPRQIDRLIELAVDRMKKYLAENKEAEKLVIAQ